jgi:serine/threonine protein kinase/tetratricopeptide (TPR) repeat protein
MSESEMRSGRVLELAEEFLERYRNGERPPLKEYTDRHPDLAEEIREVFPAMAMMENIAVADSSLEGGEEATKSKKPGESTLTQLGDYRIIRVIGHGGMGVVYEAEQVSLGRHVALKVLPNQALADEKHKRRFEREAKAAAKLHHTNIVPVFGVGEHEGLPYYVMQYIQGLGLDVVLDELNHMQPGGERTPTGGLPTAGEIRISRRDEAAAEMARSLMTGEFRKSEDSSDADRTQAPVTVAATVDQAARDLPRPKLPAPSSLSSASHSGSFTVSSSSITLPGTSGTGKKSSGRKQSYWQSVANIGRQVAEALEYAHKQGVLHRDVKPSNLLLDLRGTVWVTDFGLAKVAGPGGDNLTHTGDILGTLRYMPPEAFEGKSDARSDVYSLGLTMYELIAMRPAYEEKDRNKLIKRVTTGEPAPLHKVNRDAPRDLVTIIQKAIDRDPHRRYATADDMASDLQRFLDDEPIQARRQTQVERYWRWARHNPGIAVLGGVLTAVLMIATLASLVVAGRMATLADNEAKSAADERSARLEADEAKDREAKERDLAEQAKETAEQAKKDADESRKRAEGALVKAEENFAKARAAVNDYLTAVSEDERLKAPGLQGLRVQLLQSALQFYQQFLKERGDDPTLRRELASVHLKVGEIYHDLGETAAANRSAAEARKLYEALVRELPADSGLQYGLAMALSRTGGTLRAISIVEKLIKPDDPKYHADLGELYNTMAISNTPGNSGNAANLEFLHKSLAVRERFVRLRPDDPDAHLGLSASLNNIAIRLKEDRDAEALVLLQRSHEEDEIAYRLRPGHFTTARYMTIGLNNLAKYAKKLGETDMAISAYRRRVEVFDRRARDNPTIPGFEAELVAGYTMLLSELQQAGRFEEAAKAADKARIRIAETNDETLAFFGQIVGFHLAAYAIAEARAKADPAGKLDTEPEAAAAVKAMRQYVLAGWRDPKFLRDNSIAKMLSDRADFKELLARMEELVPADQKSKLASATVEERLAARETILTTLEAIAGPLPHARSVRRALAQARQEWAQALLAAGKVEEARVAFDDALLTRQQLVQESSTNEQLRADLAQSQSAAGDLFAAAGKLADAERIWNKALATLEEGLKANPNSIPFRTSLTERLVYVANQEAQYGLWDRAAERYRKALAIQAPTLPIYWNFMAMVGAETRDAEIQRAAAKLAANGTETTGDAGLFRVRALTTSPELDAGNVDAVQKLADNYRQNPFHNVTWVRAIAYLRLGKTDMAYQLVAGLTPADTDWPELSIAALIQHRLGHADAAADSLRRSEALNERWMKEFLARGQLKWSPVWDAYLHYRQLLLEAHQTIHGKPRPASPYERLIRGRIHVALEEHEKAQSEFAAAVKIRPDDAEVWLARSRVFAKMGRKDRMAADLLRVQQLKGNDPKTWIDTGRMLAEQGEHKQADAALARVSVLGKGELNRFFESGWWVVGPYSEQLHQPCPPEVNPDPSKLVAALGEKGTLKWQSVPITLINGSILTETLPGGSQKNGSYYLLTFVHAERDRTATLNFRCSSDARVWVNGRVVLDSMLDWKFNPGDDVQIPVSLKAGRNTLLIKNRHTQKSHNWCECQFTDSPIRRASQFYHAELCEDAAAAFAEAERRSPLNTYQYRQWVASLLILGRDPEARRVFSDLSKMPDAGGHDAAVVDFLPPAKTEERDRRLANTLKFAAEALASDAPGELWRYHRLANAQLRVGEFAEAETSVRKVLTGNQPYCKVLLAIILHYRGKIDEAKKLFAETEEQFARHIKDDLAAKRYRSSIWYEEATLYLAQRCEARKLILGQVSGPSADEVALVARGVARKAELDKIDDDYARLVEEKNDMPRLWIDRGRRLGELQRWDEAKKAFDKAAELAPKNPQVWKERGRAYADLGKWDEAAADFVKAIELPGGERTREQVARFDEVFPRVAKLRPTDLKLWLERQGYTGRAARWKETAEASVKIADLDPSDHYAWHIRVTPRIRSGDIEGYRADCREMMTRFGKTKDILIAQRIAKACLLAPGGVDDPAAVVAMLKNTGTREDNAAWRAASGVDRWRSATLALGYYRTGRYEDAIKELAQFSRATGFLEIMALTVRGMAQFKNEQIDAARQTLAEARQGMAMHAAPAAGELQGYWHSWLQADLLLREAEALIPAAPAQVAQARPSAEEQAARRDRKFRADSLTTKAALAQIRFDSQKKAAEKELLGVLIDRNQKKAAENELLAVLADREKIAAEEPTNFDYQADLAATHEQLGQFMVNTGRLEEGVKATQQAVALLEKHAAGNPKAARIQVNLTGSLFKIAEFHWKAGRMAEGQTAWQRALEGLKASRNAAGKDPKIAKMAVDLELVAGRAYADLGLFAEASEHYRRAFEADPVAGTVVDRFHHAAMLVLTGDHDEYRRYCTRVHERSANNPPDRWFAKMLVLGRNALPDKAAVVARNQEARDAISDKWWAVLDVALAQFRADQTDAAFASLEEFEKVSNREWQYSWPSLALARHRAGKIDEARDWLRKSEEWYAHQWTTSLANNGDGLTKGNLFYWAFFLAQRQEAIEAVTGQPAPADAWFRLHRGRVYARLGMAEKSEAEFQAAVQINPNDLAILAARSRLYAALGKIAESQADEVLALKLTEQTLAKNPDDSAAADRFAQYVLEKPSPLWTSLKPLSVTSRNKTALTVQPDNSLLASGENPKQETHTIEFETQGPIVALRLEALADPRFPAGGPGRAFNGNFLLTEIEVNVGEQKVRWHRAFADVEQRGDNPDQIVNPVAHAFDGNPDTGWAILPKAGQSHWAVFVPVAPIGGTEKVRFTVRLACEHKNIEHHTLGRFRISTTTDPAILRQDSFVSAATTPRARVAAAYLMLGEPRQARDYLVKTMDINPNATASDWLVLALTHLRLNEPDAARAACGKAGEKLRPAGATGDPRRLVHAVVKELGRGDAAAKELIAAAAGEVPAALNEAIKTNPTDADGYRNRGSWNVEHGRLKEAIADYTEVHRITSDSLDALRVGILLYYAGEHAAYREHCRAMLNRYRGTTSDLEADRTLKLIALTGDALGEEKEFARFAKVALSGDESNGARGWFLFAKGMHDYRVGRFSDAIEAARASRKRFDGGPMSTLNLVLEAMAEHRLGEKQSAAVAQKLSEAKAELDRNVPGIDNVDIDWMYAHLLYAEAEVLIAKKKSTE